MSEQKLKTFAELALVGEQPNLDFLFAALEQKITKDESQNWMTPGWNFNRKFEKQMSTSDDNEEPLYCFSCTSMRNRRAAHLWLSKIEQGRLQVSNIVPATDENSPLSCDQYNWILDEFYYMIMPFADQFNVKVEYLISKLSLNELVGPTTIKWLNEFTESANKLRSASHPKDTMRWHMFIVAAHQEGSKIGPINLARWLTVVKGWPKSMAQDWAINYEKSRQLLVNYNQYVGNWSAEIQSIIDKSRQGEGGITKTSVLVLEPGSSFSYSIIVYGFKFPWFFFPNAWEGLPEEEELPITIQILWVFPEKGFEVISSKVCREAEMKIEIALAFSAVIRLYKEKLTPSLTPELRTYYQQQILAAYATSAELGMEDVVKSMVNAKTPPPEDWARNMAEAFKI